MAELTVASFNTHWGMGPKWRGHLPFDVVDACRTIDADVLVLQESWFPDGGTAQHAEVAAALGYDAVAVSLARATGDPHPSLVDRADPAHRKGAGDWCLAVLSRLPVTGTRTIPLPQLPTDPSSRAVVRVDVEVDGLPLAVHGTHLAHLEMGVPLIVRRLRAALAPATEAAILIGDMNMWSWCISAMAPRGWRRTGRGATFPATRPLARIDHLLTTSSVEVLSTEVLPDLGSDHRAIRARLRLS